MPQNLRREPRLILLLAPGSRTIEARRQNIIFPGVVKYPGNKEDTHGN